MSMNRLMNSIKQAGIGAVNAGDPVAILFGVVESANPLKVQVDQRFPLTAEFLVVTESLTQLELELQHTHQYTDEAGTVTKPKVTDSALSDAPIVVRRGLEAGDKVLLLRMQGGQKYIILDKVVSG